MTPELKSACEVVFQEHKLSAHPVKWSRDTFHGKISAGLSEMAKLTLVDKNIILPNKQKRIFTQLNPCVAAAGSFEEAEKMIETKVPAIEKAASIETSEPVKEVPKKNIYTPPVISIQNLQPVAGLTVANVSATKWYLKPIYLYVVWPLCGAAGGALISFLMNFIYTEIFR
jgi:hypothetical protein